MISVINESSDVKALRAEFRELKEYIGRAFLNSQLDRLLPTNNAQPTFKQLFAKLDGKLDSPHLDKREGIVVAQDQMTAFDFLKKLKSTSFEATDKVTGQRVKKWAKAFFKRAVLDGKASIGVDGILTYTNKTGETNHYNLCCKTYMKLTEDGYKPQSVYYTIKVKA